MNDDETERYLEWIREGLKPKGKTQTGLAAHLGVAHPQITQLLKGRRRLKVDEVPKIAEYLGTPPPEPIKSRDDEVRALWKNASEEAKRNALILLRAGQIPEGELEPDPEGREKPPAKQP